MPKEEVQEALFNLGSLVVLSERSCAAWFIADDKPRIFPSKRPDCRDTHREQRELNRLISKVRITAENVINRIKKFRACKEFFWNQPSRHGLIWGCVAGLVNLRWQR